MFQIYETCWNNFQAKSVASDYLWKVNFIKRFTTARPSLK